LGRAADKVNVEHPSDDLLETYALGTIPELEITLLEEHLLTCEKCRKRLAVMDLEITAVRQALRLAGTPSFLNEKAPGARATR
jgi:anti-sigma factor RsiW